MFQNVKGAVDIICYPNNALKPLDLEHTRLYQRSHKFEIFRKTLGLNDAAGCCLQMQVGWNLWQCAAGRRMTPPS